MPSPPCQTANASQGLRPGAKYSSESVITLYSRAPTIPAGTAQIAMSAIAPARPPRATHRRLAHPTETTIPARMHSAYARTGNGPRCHTPCDGLGMAATSPVGHVIGGPSAGRERVR